MVQATKHTVGNTVFEEGDTINRLGNVWPPDLAEHDPDYFIREAAQQLTDAVPDQLPTTDAEDLATRLTTDPTLFNDIDAVRYNSMKLKNINEGHGDTQTTLTLHDWQTEETITLDADTFENHLGTTLFATTDSD